MVTEAGGPVPGSEKTVEPRPAPGVTRFDLLCQPRVVESALDLMGRWARDRALPDDAQRRLDHLVRAALRHGLRFGPRGLTILVRWLDAERVRVDLRWLGGHDAASPDREDDGIEATISVLDALAVEWGVGRTGGGWVQWLVADAG